MDEPLVLTAPRTKRAEIEKHIEALTAGLSDARSHLLHVVAVMRMSHLATASERPAKSTTSTA